MVLPLPKNFKYLQKNNLISILNVFQNLKLGRVTTSQIKKNWFNFEFLPKFQNLPLMVADLAKVF